MLQSDHETMAKLYSYHVYTELLAQLQSQKFCSSCDISGYACDTLQLNANQIVL